MLYQKIIYCCRLLGVTTQANIATIKKAYWQKSKQYHPDVNPSADAHNTFIALTDAYDFLHDMLSSNATLESYKQQYANTNATSTSTTTSTSSSYTNDAAYEAQKMADARARYYAFIHSDEYKAEVAMQNIGQFFKCLFLGAVVIASIIGNIIILINGEEGGWLLVISAVFFGMLFSWNYPLLTIKTLPKDLPMLFKDHQVTRVLIGFLGICIQFAFMFSIWMSTLIEFWIPLLSIVFVASTAYLIISLKKPIYTASKKLILAVLIIPNIINLLLVCNYAFAHSSYKQGYYISYINENKPFNKNGIYMMQWFYFFEKYENYPSINDNRRDKIPDGYTYTVYTFKKGLLGIDVIDSIDYL